jgi:DNA-binding LacI/PurR family transcriptional regulator
MSVVKIAKQAGVSIATVSRVLTNSRYVQPQTADKVRSAMEELGLTDRQNRRSERRLGSVLEVKNVGVISVGREYRSWFVDPVVAAMVAELTRAASARRIGVVLGEMPDPDKLCSIVEEKRIDGALLLIPSEIESTVSDRLMRQLPAVRVMGAQYGPTRIDHVTGDHSAIGYLAAKYLIQKGCKRLAFITQHAEWPICQMRAQAFFSAADAIQDPAPVESVRAFFIPPGVPVDNSYGKMSITASDWPDLMRKFLEYRPDGLFVSREAELSQCYRLLAEHNLKPSRDITVISCDNCDTWLSHLEQRPATIDLGLTQMADAAVSRLLMRIKYPEEPPTRVLINPQLVLPH